ncbi:extracellular solute-binding protein [Acidiferrobacter sp.]|uniref:extracellular solute-binding protein n=1 Tax=Acidiferrobacter sp. TaxID=1872107 RepID=UPI0026103430|nr:extracellular solute-binding protein [Acidiferrobacter sp.]
MSLTRRAFLQSAAMGIGALALPLVGEARAQTNLQVAYAGSMGALMHGAVAPVMAREFAIDIEGRAQGALGLAHMIVAGAIRPDVFISITRGPMDIVLGAHKAREALAIASTELVIAYSPRTRFTSAFREAGRAGHAAWWRILEEPGMRFARTDPLTDPQGLNIVFMMRLAERYYHKPGLARRILGPVINHRQIFPEPEVMARLQGGQFDASSAYKTQPAAMGLPYLSLPPAINLGDAAYEKAYDAVSLRLNGRVHRPSPLVFYAAVLTESEYPDAGERFIDWLRGPAGQAVLRRYHYDGPKGAAPLRP